MKDQRRSEALARWRAVEAGNFDDDTRAWLSEVAARVIAANDEKDPNDFRLAVARAVGLSGSKGPKVDTSIRLLFDHLGPDALTDPAKKNLLRKMVQALWMGADWEGPKSNGAIDEAIRRAIKK
jgi:hypothetical protein